MSFTPPPPPPQFNFQRLVPSFDPSVKGKVNRRFAVVHNNNNNNNNNDTNHHATTLLTLDSKKATSSLWSSAIASRINDTKKSENEITHINSNQTGTYIYTVKVRDFGGDVYNKNMDNFLMVGFTSNTTLDEEETVPCYPSSGLSGCSLSTFWGETTAGDERVLETNLETKEKLQESFARKATEITCVLKIDAFAEKMHLSWIVDGVLSASRECRGDFFVESSAQSKNRRKEYHSGRKFNIYPCISLSAPGQQVEILAREEKNHISHLKMLEGKKLFLNRLYKFFAEHAPYNLSRVEQIVKNFQISEEEYFEQLKIMYGL